jgi:1,4-alpha-glucan branching enzyme
MLLDSQIDLVRSARHGDPFSVLGVHADADDRRWLRAFLPDASQVVALDTHSGELIAVLGRRHADGFFEAVLPQSAPSDYRLQVRWSDGSSSIVDDPYRFGPTLSAPDLARLAAGAHLRPCELLGATPRVVERVSGTGFAVWAPNASRVSVVGDFNRWDPRLHGMRRREEAGVWEIFLPGIGVGAPYKYEIRSQSGRALPAKADPYALRSLPPPATASVVARLPPVSPAAASLSPDGALQGPMSIYEVHLASWRRKDGDERRLPDWDELAQTLAPYARELGFTHIELLPVCEHPFDGSWGYQPVGLYAPTARFGDPAGLRRFVARCHAEGLRVLLDWVPTHFPADPHGLAQFDGSRLYENAEPADASHSDWNTLAYNAARPEVHNFLAANALFWLERYDIDGLRVGPFDAALSGTGARDLLREVHRNLPRLRPQAVTIGDGPPDVAVAIDDGGLGFGLRWHRSWAESTLRYMERPPSRRAARPGEMSGHADGPDRAVLALSHEQAASERGSLLARMPGSRSERFANLRAYYGFMYAHPGRKLLFMGHEFAQERGWNHERELDWPLLQDPAHRGMQRLVCALNGLLRTTPALHERDFDPAGFEWIEAGDGERPVLAFARFGLRPDALLVAVCNFGDAAIDALRIGVPRAGRYVECLNTDAVDYGGAAAATSGSVRSSEAIAAHGKAQSVSLALPPLCTLMFAWHA